MTNQDDRTSAEIRRLKRPRDRAAPVPPTDFFFYGEPEFIRELGDILARQGFGIRPAGTDYPGLIASIAMPDGDRFTRTANWLASLAGDLGVEFDGWEAGSSPGPH